MAKNWFKVRAQTGDSVQVDVYDFIGYFGITAVDFRRDVMNALRASDASSLRVNIHSPGGAVFEALAIYNFLNGLSSSVVVETRVEGLAASAASLIAMAGDVRSMADSAFLMIHEPSLIMEGRADELRDAADFLEKLRQKMLDIYVEAADDKLDYDRAAEMLDAETWLTASEAYALGLTDDIVKPLRAVAQLDLTAFRVIPEALKTRKETESMATAEKPEKTTEQVSAEERAKIQGEMAEISELCALAGRPEMFADFVKASKTVAEVRAELVKLGPVKAEAAPTEELRPGKAINLDADRLTEAVESLRYENVYARYNSAGKRVR